MNSIFFIWKPRFGFFHLLFACVRISECLVVRFHQPNPLCSHFLCIKCFTFPFRGFEPVNLIIEKRFILETSESRLFWIFHVLYWISHTFCWCMFTKKSCWCGFFWKEMNFEAELTFFLVLFLLQPRDMNNVNKGFNFLLLLQNVCLQLSLLTA